MPPTMPLPRRIIVLSLEREVSRAEALEIGNSAMTRHREGAGIRDEIEVLENDRDLIGSADRESPTGDGLQPGSGERENTRFVARIEPATGTVAVHDKELGRGPAHTRRRRRQAEWRHWWGRPLPGSRQHVMA